MCKSLCRISECSFAWIDAREKTQIRVWTGRCNGACSAVHRHRGKCRGCLDAAWWEVLMGDGRAKADRCGGDLENL